MKITYTAFDGKTFDGKFDCLEYERQSKIDSTHFVALNEKLEPTKKLSEVWYVNIATDEDAEILSKISRQNYEVSFPEHAGQWCYDENNDEWVKIDDRISDLQWELEKFMKINLLLGGKE